MLPIIRCFIFRCLLSSVHDKGRLECILGLSRLRRSRPFSAGFYGKVAQLFKG